MRVIINIQEVRDKEKGRRVQVRTCYYSNSKDCLRVRNCGVELYNCIKDGFDTGFSGGEVIHEGEKS